MLNFAIETARMAGRSCSRNSTGNRYTEKGDINLVTEADLASEALIIERIRSYYPKHAISRKRRRGCDLDRRLVT